MVYVREAHPSDGWQMESNVAENLVIEQPKTLVRRQEVASACAIGLKLSIPMLIDSIDDRADRLFKGWPERLYVLSPEGTVAYQGGKGPFGFDPEELSRFLADYLPRDGVATGTT